MEKRINYAIKKITTEQFAIVEDLFLAGKEIKLEGAFRFGIEAEDKSIQAVSSFRLEQEKAPFLLIEVSCQFAIEDESWKRFADKEAERIIIDKGFATHLLSLAVGTARGVLHSKTEGTIFNQYLLPTIDLSEAVKTDLTFSIHTAAHA